jgi:hypothetical protein
MIKAQLKEAGSSKELFPHKLGVSHRRSGAFDAADATAALFSQQMSVPFTDGRYVFPVIHYSYMVKYIVVLYLD